MSAWDLVVVFAFALWGVAAVVAQVRPARRRLLRWWDRSAVGALLPTYTFFAPRPATNDQRLVVRHWREDEPTAWLEVIVTRPRSWLHLVWNPDKRQGKALSDLVRNIATAQPTIDELPLNNGYLMFLMVADKIPAPAGATHVQFALLESPGIGASTRTQARLVSRRHLLSANEPTGP